MMDDTFKKTTAASLGALLTSLTVAPLEVVKTRLQVQAPDVVHTPPVARKASHYCFSNGLMDTMLPKEGLLQRCKCGAEQICEPPAPRSRPSLLRTMARIVRLEGPLALYSGLPPTLLIAVPSTAIYFTSYESLLKRLRDKFPSQSTSSLAIIAGSVARTGATTIFSPLEVIRVRMQATADSAPFLQHLRQVISAGPAQLCAGLGATLARDIPFSAVYWFGIESAKPWLSGAHDLRAGSDGAQGRCRVLIWRVRGVSSRRVVTHPFDVVKTRAQVSLYASSDARSTSALQLLRRVWQTEGLRGVTSGLAPRAVKVVPACAIMISTYEAAKIAFHIQDT
ncbi:hypothetical protein PINS_up007935 [Pythium insidiosum]|nr:hypothetical protein PINS_up007935 [Pythium insidiosum]